VTASAVPPHPPGAIWLESGDGGAVLHLQGEVDAANVARRDQDRSSPWAEGRAARRRRRGGRLRRRLPRLRRGWRCWSARPAHRRAGGRPELRNPSRVVLQVLRLTGVAGLFDVVTG